jgi:hypothetical protein
MDAACHSMNGAIHAPQFSAGMLVFAPFDDVGFILRPLVAPDGCGEHLEVFLDYICEYVEVVHSFGEYAAKIV